MDDRSGKTYEVGYGRPPKEHRIKPGERRNPRGRPKKRAAEVTLDVSLVDLVHKEGQALITIRENNRECTITKKEALVRRMLNDALNGKASAMKAIVPFLEKGSKPGAFKAVPDVRNVDVHVAAETYRKFINDSLD